jgi:hypothetical protein
VTPTRIDLLMAEELAGRIAQASATVGETDRAWSRAALLRAARRSHVRIGQVPPGGAVRRGIPLDAGQRARIDAAVERSGLTLSDWVRSVLSRAADVEISEDLAGSRKSTEPGKKR